VRNAKAIGLDLGGRSTEVLRQMRASHQEGVLEPGIGGDGP
jgi:hypothetical protein